MTLSRRGDYVTRSAIALARVFDAGRPRKIRELVTETAVPQTFASQILGDLVRTGLATSRAGRDGGYRLSRPPSEITVLEVIEAAEGPLRAERCALGEGPCRWEMVCPLHETFSAATVALRELLAATTLAELAARDLAIETSTYAVPDDAHRAHPTAVAVADRVDVEVPAHDTCVALARLAPELGVLAEAAASAANEVLRPLAAPIGADRPGAARPTRSGRPGSGSRAALAPIGGRDGEGRAGGEHLVALELATAWGPARLEATLSVTAVDEERCELRLEGSWRQALGDGERLAAAVLERLARRGVRAFLRELAGAVEGPVRGETATRQPRGATRQPRAARGRARASRGPGG